MPYNPTIGRMTWSGEDHLDPGLKAVIQVLQEAKDSIVNGEIETWLPDPLFRWRGKALSLDEIQQFMAALDAEFDHELIRYAHTWVQDRGFTRAPGFSEMPLNAQVALAQRLDEATPLEEPPIRTF